MMYEDFKRELYRNVMHQRRGRDVVVRLLECHMICADEEGIQMIKLINLACYGVKDIIVREDILCLSWGEGGLVNMKYWRVQLLFQRFQTEGWMGVLPEILVKLQEGGSRLRRTSGYEQSRRRHILRPMNYYLNRAELENCIYWRFGDIALVLYDLMYESEDECTTMKINREMAEEWCLEDEALLRNALLNTRDRMPPRLFAGNDPEEGGYDDGIFMPEDGAVSIHIHRSAVRGGMGYRLTTVRRINGAIAIFYPSIKERLAWMIKGDYYVGFPSIHEAVIHPVRYGALCEMKEAIRHTNLLFDQRDMLTGRVYRYMESRQELLEV
ncbi:MAG: DUF5688 family protein [Candidatus Gastranaerophilales bacterium]|nr:DUF5688 family protein [Candidatus Gastranaerophilales bacterium]